MCPIDTLCVRMQDTQITEKRIKFIWNSILGFISVVKSEVAPEVGEGA